jgi:hypothetical protein
VVDEQLTATVEQLRQRARAVVGVKAVLLLHPNPGQLAAPLRQLVAQSGVLLLAGEQLAARSCPLGGIHDLVIGHRYLLSGPNVLT